MFGSKYVYNSQSLSYVKANLLDYYKHYIIGSAAVLIASIIIGSMVDSKAVKVEYSIDTESGMHVMPSKHAVALGSTEWKDSVFHDYQVRADLYIKTRFPKSPVKGEVLALAAHNAYDSTGILLPVELALAQCQWESGMGLKGRSPKNNPFNIGEYDSGTVVWFDNTFEGVQAYYNVMCNDYLSCHSLSELFTNFVNCNGYRYASGPYEDLVPKQYYFIKRWLKKNMK